MVALRENSLHRGKRLDDNKPGQVVKFWAKIPVQPVQILLGSMADPSIHVGSAANRTPIELTAPV
jgi:hypothetical protein